MLIDELPYGKDITDHQKATHIYEPINELFYKEIRLVWPKDIVSENEISRIETGRIFKKFGEASREEDLENVAQKFSLTKENGDVIVYDPRTFLPFWLRLWESKDVSIKINVCCGDDYREGYINIDFSDKRSDGKDIKVDLKRDVLKDGLPYETCSVDEVVFRESLEHFNRHDGLKILQELYRVLKIGGKLDLTVPPALQQLKILLLQMSNSKNVSITDFFKAHERFSVWKYHDDLMGATREGSFGDSHATLFTKEMLKPILEFVGFKVEYIDDNIQVRAIK